MSDREVAAGGYFSFGEETAIKSILDFLKKEFPEIVEEWVSEEFKLEVPT